MPEIAFDLHTHTTMSHGRGTPEENVLFALRQGLSKIAITDHGPAHLSYSIHNLQAYLAEISRLKAAYAGKIEILCGVELNLTSLAGETDLPRELAARFDVQILGYHKLVRMTDFRSQAHFAFRAQSNAACDANTAALEAAITPAITILAHPGQSICVDKTRLATRCAKTGTLFELNSSHGGISACELKQLASTGVRFIVSSDAHRPENVGRAYAALALIKESGIDPAQVVNLP